jgi:ankyrin repeat protein
MARILSLYYVIAKDNIEVFQQMVTQNPTILRKIVSSLGVVPGLPIHYAAKFGSNKILKLILSCSPELLDVQNEFNRSGLLIAAAADHQDTVDLFMQFGSTALDTPDISGFTPLHHAVYNNNIEMIELLLELGSKAIDVVANNTAYNFKLIPLTLAVINNKPKLIELLIKRGSKFLDFDATQPDIYRSVLKQYTIMPTSFRTLLALGYDQELYTSYCVTHDVTPVEPFDEDEIAEIRWRVYFDRSLVYRCLFDKY